MFLNISFNRDATAAAVKKVYRKLCLRCHLYKNSSPCASKLTKILNQAKIYINDYFYYIDSKLIEIHYSDSASDTEETQKILSVFNMKHLLRIFSKRHNVLHGK